MLIDAVLGQADFRERHSVRVDAPPAATLAAARAVTVREVPLFVVLMALRGLPALLRRRHAFKPDVAIMAGFEELGFAVAAASADELVVVGSGRFWRPGGGLRPLSAGEFETFAEPGFARTAFNFRVTPDGEGCTLSTETRIVATDDSAQRAFRRYWRLVRPGSGAIRLAWLRAIRRRAEAGY